MEEDRENQDWSRRDMIIVDPRRDGPGIIYKFCKSCATARHGNQFAIKNKGNRTSIGLDCRANRHVIHSNVSLLLSRSFYCFSR